MNWWKRKKISGAYEERQRLVRGCKRGAMLLEDMIEYCDGKSNPIKFFSAEQIIKATDKACKCHIPPNYPNVCECTCVRELSKYGGWYSGMLDNHHMILLLVKNFWRLKPLEVDLPEVRDITISSMVSGHKNFMKLVGSCLETEIPLMIYYGEKKQYSHLDLEMVVSWGKRIKIAEEIATALAYLHTAFSRPLLYCNMDLRNILLDEHSVAKLIDFSNCVSIPHGETFVKVPILRTSDYMMDHYVVVSEKTDAFEFGILMQKLLTGQEKFSEFYGWNEWEIFKKGSFQIGCQNPLEKEE